MMTERNGHLEAYWEQGWEGRIEYCFFDIDRKELLFLKNGDRLTIYAEGDSILWSGEIHFVRRGWCDRHQLDAGIWSDSKQKGVSYKNWMAWFWHKPSLKGDLNIKE